MLGSCETTLAVQVGRRQWERVLEMVRRIRALDMEVCACSGCTAVSRIQCVTGQARVGIWISRDGLVAEEEDANIWVWPSVQQVMLAKPQPGFCSGVAGMIVAANPSDCGHAPRGRCARRWAC